MRNVRLSSFQIAFLSYFLLFFSTSIYSQSTTNYTFATNTTGSLALDANGNAIDMSTGTTSIHGTNVDDGAGTLTNFNLGAGTIFEFYFMGSRYTQFSANSNGMIQLGTLIAGSAYNIPQTSNPVIAPFSSDLKTGTDGAVRCKVVGTAPNRCLVVEYFNMMLLYGSTNSSGTGTFQARLYETTGVIEYVYGAMARNANTPTTSTVTIGFSTNTTANNVVTINSNTNVANTTASITTNTYTASTTITDLNSASNGSRRVYSFTPPAAPTAPTWAAASSITATGMTLNWTDNASNETGYIILRSADNTTFTQQGTILAANTQTLAVTGLTPGIQYFWRIIAVREGTGAEATGNATTLSAAVYYWTGTATAEFNTAATWNTAADGSGSQRTTALSTDILIIDGEGTVAGGAITAGTVNANASVGVLRITNSTAVTLTGVTSTRTITVTGGVGDDFDIQSGSTLTLNGATAISIIFSGTNNTGNIAGTLTLSGGTSNAITSTGGTGTVVTVTSTGIINNAVAAASGNVTGSAATLVFANGSAYNVSGATTGAPALPLATWGASSTITISGLTTSTTAPTNNAQSFGNLIYNCPAASATMSFFASTTTAVIQGNLTIQATNTGRFRAVTSGTLTINGNLIINGGTFEVASTSGIVNTVGVTLAGGTLDFTSGTSTATLRVSGTFNQTSGVFARSGSSTTHLLEFNGTSSQSVTMASNAIVIPYRINNNAGINLSGTMSINSGASLRISSTAATPINGGTLTYTGTTTLIYDGIGNQTPTANEWPAASGPINITINNTGTAGTANRVSLHAARTIGGILTMTSGVLQLGAFDLTISSAGSVSGTASNTNFIATNGAGQLFHTYAATGSKTFPTGSITPDAASAVTVNYTALTGTSVVGLKVFGIQNPNDVSPTNYLARYYAFTQSGASAGTYTLTLNYQSADVAGTASLTRVNRWNGSDWTKVSGAAPSATSVTATGLDFTTLNATSEFTLRPAVITTYTWRGGPSGAWSTAGNWNPSRSSLDLGDILQFDGSNIDGLGGTGNITANALPSSETFGSLVLLNNANVNLQASTSSSILTLSGGTGTDLDVPSGSTLTLSGTSTNTLGLSYSGTGNVASIIGTLNLGSGPGTGAITYNCLNATTTIDGSVNSGTSTAAGTFSNASTTLLLINGTYNHNQNAGTIPTANYALVSNVNVNGVFGTAPTPPSSIGGNFTWNSTGQTGTSLSLLSTLSSIGGNCTIQSTGTGSMQFGASPTLAVTGLTTISGGTLLVAGGTLNFNGGLTISSGSIAALSGALTSTINVNGNYTQSGGTLTSATSSTSITLNVTGTFNQSAGTISHTSVGSMAINLTGSNIKNVTLNGTNTTGIINWTINNGNNNGINLTGTLPINAGAFLTSSIGGTAVTGGTVTFTGSGALRYNAATNQTAGIEWPATNSPASVTIANTGIAPNNIITAPGTRTISGTLTMTSGDLDFGANNLTLGTSAAAIGTLTYTAGSIRVTSGSFTRFYGTTSLPTTSGTTSGYFPLAFGTNNRNVNVYFSTATALTTGGSITVSHTDAAGTSVQNFLDGAYQVDKRTNALWTISQTGLVASGTISVRLSGGGLSALAGTSTSNTTLRLIQDGAASGTFVASSYSAPNFRVERTGLTVAQFGNIHYIGGANTDIPTLYTAVASSDWSLGTTWDQGTAPGAGDVAIIPSSFNVTTDAAAANVCNSLTINSGGTITSNTASLAVNGNMINNGTLAVGGGTVNITGTLTNAGTTTASSGTINVTAASTTGITNTGTFTVSGGTVALSSVGNNNRTFSNATPGILTVSSGNLNIFGNLAVGTGCTFNQSGGTITVDGNDNGGANSVASSTVLVSIGSPLGSVTGGTMTIVDPPATGTARSFVMNFTSGNLQWGAGHTLIFGNGSTDASTNTSGFQFDTYVGSVGTQSMVGSVTVNGGNATNRWVTTTSSSANGSFIKGNLTINNGSELRDVTGGGALVLSGDLTNNGTMSMTSVATRLATFTGSTEGATGNAQTIGGLGTFRNSLTSSTANFINMTVNNSNVSGVTLNGIDLSLSGTLTFTLGKVNTGANKVVLIAGASTSGAAQATGYIVGNLQRNYATGTNVSRIFDIGTTNYTPATFNFASVTSGGNLTVSTTTNDHPNLATSGLRIDKTVNRFWTATNSGITFTTYSTSLGWQSADNDGGITAANLRVGKFDSPSTWELPTISGTPTATSIVTTNSLTGFSDFVVAELCSSPTISLGSNPSVCFGTTSANLSYSATTNNPNQYNINYDAAAEAQGFVDVVNASLPATPVVLTVPDAAVADTYNATLTVTNSTTGCVSAVQNITVTVSPAPALPSINPSANQICPGTSVTFTAGNGSQYEFFKNAVSLGSPSRTNTYTTAVLANNDEISVRSYTPFTFDGNIVESPWGTALATSAGGPTPGFGAGHEINAVYVQGDANNINVALAGNVQDMNKILLFIDSKSGGYTDGNFGRDNSPAGLVNFNSGTTFDAGFEPDYCLVIGTNGAMNNYFFDLYTLSGTAGSGGGPNTYLGDKTTSFAGAVTGADPLNSSNTRGFEVAIPKLLLGYLSGIVKVMAMYTGNSGFLSNQFLTPAGSGDGNYGSGAVTFGSANPDAVIVPAGNLINNCYSSASVIMQVEGTVVKNSADAGFNTLRSVYNCIADGGPTPITYDQPTTAATLLTNPLTINKTLTIMGAGPGSKPEITVDFTGLGMSPGIMIGTGKTVTLMDVDVKDINNTNMPNNAVIEVQGTGTLKVTGSTVINKIP